MGHEVSIGDFSQYERSKRRSLCGILPDVVPIEVMPIYIVPIDDENKEACTQTDELSHNEPSYQTDSGYINFLESDNVALGLNCKD